MNKEKIKEAMQGNQVWCCNFQFNNGSASECKHVRCTFKHGHAGIAKAGELKECKSFWITKHTNHFESGIPVLIHPNVE